MAPKVANFSQHPYIKILPKERRVLLTHWAGEAYSKLCLPEYDDLRWRIFVRTGCLLTADGSDDHLVAPEGLSEYAVPPPAIHVEASANIPNTNDSDGVTEPPLEAATETEQKVPEEREREDLVEDRQVDEFCGRKLKALYDNGWVTGTIQYINTALGEYNVAFDDGTDDYFSMEDVDGVEMMLL